jgi:hypothetical protein
MLDEIEDDIDSENSELTGGIDEDDEEPWSDR